MNPLIVWNDSFGIDVQLTEKPGGSFAQAEIQNCSRVKL